MEYTKGEWKVDLSRITGHVGISIDGDDNQVANVYLKQLDSRWVKGTAITRPENAESLANAHLIAAAPDLYEALVEADEVICELCKRLNPQHKNCTSCQDREVRLKAIAKAEGK